MGLSKALGSPAPILCVRLRGLVLPPGPCYLWERPLSQSGVCREDERGTLRDRQGQRHLKSHFRSEVALSVHTAHPEGHHRPFVRFVQCKNLKYNINTTNPAMNKKDVDLRVGFILVM